MNISKSDTSTNQGTNLSTPVAYIRGGSAKWAAALSKISTIYYIGTAYK